MSSFNTTIKSSLRIGFRCLAWVCLCSLYAHSHAESSLDKLNVLFIAVDDLRVELGCYGSPWVKSPHLDSLAERSLLFRHAYCQQSVCNPSRASLLTGLRIDTLGIYDLHTHFRDLRPDIVTLPELFKNHGYQAYGLGKIFHNFSQDAWQGDARSWSAEQYLHYGNHNLDSPKVSGVVPPNQIEFPRMEKRDVPDNAYLDGQIADKAVATLRQLRDQPFFLGVGFWKPHLPFNAPAKYWDLYELSKVPPPANPHPPENVPAIALHSGNELMRDYRDGLTEEQVQLFRQGYYAAITYVDAQIGKVLDELDRLGLREKTIVVFWSDHGFHLGEHALWCKTSNFELDAHVPMMISVPGQTTAGQATDALVELLDLYPTLVDYCNLPAPHALEGTSLRPMIENEQASVRPYALTQNPRPAYRKRDEAPEVMGYSIRTARYRYTQWQDHVSGQWVASELYDHQRDPRETINIIDEPAAQGVKQQHALLMTQALSGRHSRGESE